MRPLSIVFVAGLFATALVAQTPPVNCAGKLSESQVEKLLSSGVSEARVEQQFVRRCGIAFEVTPAAAARLRRAGASEGLIGVLREIQPKRPEPVAKKDTRPTAEKETSTPSRPSKRVNPKDGLNYVWIPPGTFKMGCSAGDDECSADEKPAHRVTITKGFWIGQTEVTQAAYERVIGNNPSHFKKASLPVETISWHEAGAYCKAVGMRLPTEAEWEYAARGGNTAAHYGALDAVAWYGDNSERKTHEVGKKQANGYGLYDTLGNVREWVAGWYGEKYYASSPASDPKGPSSGQYHTMRGGSWDDISGSARVSFRGRNGPGYREFNVGVRCAGDSL
jgi:formylglycine-generating enzyme required for sulfatase activity